MSFCTKCGARNEGNAFCSSCGERLVVEGGSAVGARTGSSGAVGLSPGEIIMLIGAGVAVLSFFLPWASVGFFGQTSSITDIGAAKQLSGMVALEPILAVGVIGLLFLNRQGAGPSKIMTAGWQILLGSTFALFGITGLFVPVMSGALDVGWWGFTLGYTGIIIGAFVMLRRLAYPPSNMLCGTPGSDPSKPTP